MVARVVARMVALMRVGEFHLGFPATGQGGHLDVVAGLFALVLQHPTVHGGTRGDVVGGGVERLLSWTGTSVG